MIEAELWKKRRFEGRGPACVLMGYIDDATGRVYGRFYEYEGTIPAMGSFMGISGRIESRYVSTWTRTAHTKLWESPTLEDDLNSTEPVSEFGRALADLGVQLIHAHSPQAKGRVERLFNTFQDRWSRI